MRHHSGSTRSAESAAGLPAAVVDDWQSRIGALDPLGGASTRYLRRVGRQGLDGYLETFRVSAEHPDAFEEYLYWRPLTRLMTFSLLRTPCTTARTPDLVKEFRSDFILVGAQQMVGGGTVSSGTRTLSYSHPRHLVAVDNNAPFVQSSRMVADLAGVWVPTELLGPRPLGGWSMAPLVEDSPLARATAAFITRFANDVAVRQCELDPGAELAVAELVRAALAPHRSDAFRAADSELYVREVAGQLIEQHYRDPDFSGDAIASMLYLSRRHMYRFFADSDETPAVLIARRRLAHARELLLRQPHMNLREVAAASGFRSAGTLSKRFSVEYGLTPSQLRQAAREGALNGDSSAAD